MSINHAFEIQNLHVGYARKKIIKDLNITGIPRGQVTLLLGPNGCGKSTLMRGIAGLGNAKGALLLNQIDLTKLSISNRAKKVVYMPQSIPVGIHLHVFESILVAAKASHSTQGITNEKVMEILIALGIEHLALAYLDELSGGQKQLVSLAQSLVRNPDLLLLDEPLSALDLNYQYHVMELVKQETRQRDIVTIVVVHDINIALRHADYVIMLKEGHLIAHGSPESVITSDNLATVYGVSGRIESCSSGYSQVFIDGLVSSKMHQNLSI